MAAARRATATVAEVEPDVATEPEQVTATELSDVERAAAHLGAQLVQATDPDVGGGTDITYAGQVADVLLKIKELQS